MRTRFHLIERELSAVPCRVPIVGRLSQRLCSVVVLVDQSAEDAMAVDLGERRNVRDWLGRGGWICCPRWVFGCCSARRTR